MFPKINMSSLLFDKTRVRYLIALLIMFSLMMPPFASAENRPGFVCGKFNGYVMEVPDSYIIYWAEYEGASAWDPDFINNKKGCDANFVVLPMIASWPDMQPGDQELWYKQGLEYEGLRMRVEPYRRFDTDVAFMRDAYLRLRKYENKTFDPIVYINELGLFFVKATSKLFRAEPQDRNSPYWFDEDVNGYYWAEVNGQVPVVFDCQWLPLEKRYYICEALFVMPEIGSLVEVIFTVEKLPQWRAIVSSTQQFLLSHIKR